MMTECLNCGAPVPDGIKYCDKKCGSIYRNKKAWERTKMQPKTAPENRRRSFYMTPAQSARPDRANLDRVAFLEALDEYQDEDVVVEVMHSIEVWAHILEGCGFMPTAAMNRATELVADFVWNGINLPKRSFATA